SLPMLGVARERSRRLVAGDARRLPLRGSFDRITCLYDSLNHLQSEGDLSSAFTSIRSVMDGESLFLFDVNHPAVYPAVWGTDEPYVSSGPDHHLEIATSFRSADAIARGHVTGWAVLASGQKVMIAESH